MTNGQAAKIAELSKCYMLGRNDKSWLNFLTFSWDGQPSTRKGYEFDKWDKAILRRLWHQYRHQIAAMNKNRQLREQA